MKYIPDKILVRGARVHNLKNIDVDIPLNKVVAIAGVSGSGKSSLALGVLYAEGSRRYLDALSTYTRRRMTQAEKANVDEILYVPAALALHQRPGIGGIRSTFGTGSELLNNLRLMYSRLANHRCAKGHYLEPTLAIAADKPVFCPVCGESVYAPSAEELAFNSQGACPSCGGTGIVRTVNRAALVPDESLTIEQGAVAPWNSLMWSLMVDVCRAMGVRTNVPFCELSAEEREIVFNGPRVKKHVLYKPKNQEDAAPCELDFTYYSATATVLNALDKVKDEKGMKRVERFLKEETCSKCHGTRLSEAARAPLIQGISLDKACQMPLKELIEWVNKIPDSLPPEMRPMTRSICESFYISANRLVELGLSYLSLDRATSTLSTGERQRMQLARAVRNRTTGVLYVLDEPSIGLHPANIVGLNNVIKDLLSDGNSIILVDHDVQILNEADWLIEMGPKGGAKGGRVIAQGSIEEIKNNPDSKIGIFLKNEIKIPENSKATDIFNEGKIHLETSQIHTVKPLQVDFPKGKLTVVTGVSGSGKTTLVLESLVPAIAAISQKGEKPPHIVDVVAPGIRHIKLIDATPIGINIRSTVATYVNVHDELRRIYAQTEDSKQKGFKAGDFSYNTGNLRCSACDGTGAISLDVQFLPDVNIVCPDCSGSRYCRNAYNVKYINSQQQSLSLPELLALDIDSAMEFCQGMKGVYSKLRVLSELGLGYMTLGEDTPNLSGGEAQRLKLASEMGKTQSDSIFVFDEPTIGLHPLDVQTLLGVFQRLITNGATVIVIEHDLDVIRSADYIVDMGPGGGNDGGRIVACGPPSEIKTCDQSVTGKFI